MRSIEKSPILGGYEDSEIEKNLGRDRISLLL